MQLSRKIPALFSTLLIICGLLVGINALSFDSRDKTYSYDFSAIQRGVDSITTEELQETITFLADPNKEGRRNLTLGSLLVSHYIADSLASYGFKSFTDDYFQKFDFRDVQNPDFTVERLVDWASQNGYTINSKARNIIGYLEGTTKKNEYIVIGAHYDAVGIQNGKLSPGADDNASGTAGLLEIAEAFGELSKNGVRPERSIIVVFFDAEEWGLWGSQYFTENPPVPFEKIIGMFNLDMISRNTPDEVLLIGSPDLTDFANRSPTFFEMLRAANTDIGMKLLIPGEELRQQQIFWRSDQAPFFMQSPADNRMPVLFLTSGEHPDYHQPSDTADKTDPLKTRNITRLAFKTAWQLSDFEGFPIYNE